MEKRYQVFVSSTYSDLKDERQGVIQTLMEMDCIPAGMELFPAADDEQWEFIKRVIDDCDYYLLIIGGRYGSTTKEGISYTEKEYEYAKERGLKVLAFIHEKPEEIPMGKSEIEPELRSCLITFRDKVSTGRLVKFWSTAKELPGIVALSLSKCIKAYPAIGWVRADKIASLELLEEVNELRKINQQLERQALRHKTIFAETEESEFGYIWDFIDKTIPVTISVGKVENERINYETSINLRYLYAKLTEICTHSISWNRISGHIADSVKARQLFGCNETMEESDISVSFDNLGTLLDDVTMYGFAETNYTPPQKNNDGSAFSQMRSWLNIGKTDYVFTPKMHRFKYWLAYNKLLPASIEFLNKEE